MTERQEEIDNVLEDIQQAQSEAGGRFMRREELGRMTVMQLLELLTPNNVRFTVEYAPKEEPVKFHYPIPDAEDEIWARTRELVADQEARNKAKLPPEPKNTIYRGSVAYCSAGVFEVPLGRAYKHLTNAAVSYSEPAQSKHGGKRWIMRKGKV
jgi:hypothetical protein